MEKFQPVVTATIVSDAPVDAVWDAATHHTGAMFLGATVKTDWHVGHRITFRGDWKGKPYEDKGTVHTFERNKRLAFTHFSGLSGKEDRPENYNLVTLDFAEEGDCTRVALTQSVHADAESQPRPSWQSSRELVAHALQAG